MSKFWKKTVITVDRFSGTDIIAELHSIVDRSYPCDDLYNNENQMIPKTAWHHHRHNLLVVSPTQPIAYAQCMAFGCERSGATYLSFLRIILSFQEVTRQRTVQPTLSDTVADCPEYCSGLSIPLEAAGFRSELKSSKSASWPVVPRCLQYLAKAAW